MTYTIYLKPDGKAVQTLASNHCWYTAHDWYDGYNEKLYCGDSYHDALRAKNARIADTDGECDICLKMFMPDGRVFIYCAGSMGWEYFADWSVRNE